MISDPGDSRQTHRKMYLSLTLLFLHLLGNVEISLTQNACSKLPAVLHAQMSEETKKAEYQKGNVILFTCEPGYISDQSPKFICTSLGWFPINQEKCYSCSTLPDIPHADVSAETRKPEYRAGDVIHFTCESGYSSDSAINYVCLSEGWLPVSQGVCSIAQGCGRPPPLKDGDFQGIAKDHYSHKERVTYVCQRYYVMDGPDFKTCNNGEWIGEMTCLKPCTVDEELMKRHNIRFSHVNNKKLYAAHNDVIGFSCVRGRPVGNMNMRQYCFNGVINLPTCQ